MTKETSTSNAGILVFCIWLTWFTSGVVYIKSRGLPFTELFDNASQLEIDMFAVWFIVAVGLLASALNLFFQTKLRQK